MAELFKTAPREVVRYLDERGVRATWRWRDFAPHEHALAFTAARTAGFDVVEDLRAAVRRAIVDRVPFEQFQRELTPILQAKGWWGKKAVTNPDGKTEVVQLGSARRLETIYWANTASAHAAGEWARTQATKDVLPYLQYKVSLSERKRPEHLGWVGTTLPVDHPWWRTHYPPNGWRCKCRVEQIGDYRAEQVPPEKRRAPPLNPKIWRDKRTGKTWRVPEGIDPGWQRNPGRTREVVAAAEQRRAIRAAAAPEAGPAERIEAAKTIVRRMRRTPEFEAVVNRNLGYDTRRRAEPAMQELGEFSVPAAVMTEALGRAGDIVRLNVAVARKQSHNHPEVTPDDYAALQAILDAPEDTIVEDGHIEAIGRFGEAVWFAAIDIDAEGPRLISLFAPSTRWLRAFTERRRNRDRGRP